MIESAGKPAPPPPICAHCREPIEGAWAVTHGAKVYVLCGSAACEHWATAQGLRIAQSGFWDGKPRAKPRSRRRAEPLPTFLPSPEAIDNARSAGGGWTQSTLAAWGVPWPPPKGWRADLERRWREQ